MLSRTARASCLLDSWPALYEARAKWKAELPSMRVLSRSKNAALVLAAIDFKDDRVALATAGADGCHSEAAAAPAELVDERPHDARSRCADRVTERDGPAIHVDLRLVKPEHAHRVDRHRGERLVELEQIDVVDRQAGLLERSLRRVRRRAGQVGEVGS